MNMSGENDGKGPNWIMMHLVITKHNERSIFSVRRGVEGAKEGAHIKCVTE